MALTGKTYKKVPKEVATKFLENLLAFPVKDVTIPLLH
jgi:hypothetical protein